MNTTETHPVTVAGEKEPITKEHILKAIKEIDSEGVRPHRQSIDYDVIYEGKHYPPKYLISLANVHANGEELQPSTFGGGKGSKTFKLLEQRGFVVAKRNAADDSGAQDRRNIWVEMTYVAGNIHKETGPRALGRAIWSQRRDKGGGDRYRNMRLVRKGDLIVHLIDNKHISGISIVKSETVEEVDGLKGTDWDGEAYLHELEEYLELESPLSRNDFLIEKNRDELEAIRAKEKYVFYNRNLIFKQGTYLTPCPYELASLLNRTYKTNTGHSLPHFDKIETVSTISEGTREPSYWLFAPGAGASEWEEFYADNVMAIGWSSLGDLSEFSSKKDVRTEAQKQNLGGNNPMNIAKACYEFASVVEVGDIVIVKKGRRVLLGYGIVTSDYYYDDTKEKFPNRRNVDWKRKGEWNEESDMVAKTLTDITRYPEYVARIRALLGIDERDSYTEQEGSSYTEQDALRDLFIPKDEFHEIMNNLRWKKNIILKGPPGVGKTFVSKRIAYTLIGAEDDSAVEMVQFHQSYSYEDFVRGFRPDPENASFKIEDGLFLELCRKADKNPQKNYCLIVDEINRGNLSKIFGELMLLIEKDKRGRDYTVKLPYSNPGTDPSFYIPKNIFIIGTMNTADRSLARIDYALRRRFRHIYLKPRFDEPKFSKYLTDRGVLGELTKKIVDRLTELNSRIADDRELGIDYQIGHSYFCPDDEESVFDEKWYQTIVEYEIIPLLKEGYWIDKDEDFIDEFRKLLLG